MKNSMSSIHRTVLLNETIEGLNLKPKAVVVDCTFGAGGHSALICEKYPDVKIIALDQDASAIEAGKEKFINSKCKITFINENFRNISQVLQKEGLGEIDGIILDLGLSSDQLENSGRGVFFFKYETLFIILKEKKSS